MFKRVLTTASAVLALSMASMASAHTIAYQWRYYGWGWGFQPYHVHHSHGSQHTHSHSHNGGSEHAHAHGHVPGAHHSVAAHGHGLNVRSGPSTEHRIVHVLDEGERIHVRGCDAHNWCEVTYSGHHHGWVFAQYLD